VVARSTVNGACRDPAQGGVGAVGCQEEGLGEGAGRNWRLGTGQVLLAGSSRPGRGRRGWIVKACPESPVNLLHRATASSANEWAVDREGTRTGEQRDLVAKLGIGDPCRIGPDPWLEPNGRQVLGSFGDEVGRSPCLCHGSGNDRWPLSMILTGSSWLVWLLLRWGTVDDAGVRRLVGLAFARADARGLLQSTRMEVVSCLGCPSASR